VVADASTFLPPPAGIGAGSAKAFISGCALHRLDAGATGGTLTFMVGGDKAILDRIRPWMEVMGKRIYHCGGPGMGLSAKLTQNLVLSNILQAFNEGIVLSTKAGVDPQLMLEVLSNSAAKSGLIEYKAPFVFKRDFTTNFSVKWMDKDIGLMLETGRGSGYPFL
jgi:3-hydroxyisobutyrate dehydrogenase/2-hydroxy-3-oxopropionate reductase